MKIINITIWALCLGSSVAIAGEHKGREKFKQMRIEACADLELGAACSFEGRKGQVEGLCVKSKKEANVKICKDPKKKEKKRGKKDH